MRGRTKNISIPGHEPTAGVGAFTRTLADTHQHLRWVLNFQAPLHIVDRCGRRAIATCYPKPIEFSGPQISLTDLTRSSILDALKKGHVTLIPEEGGLCTLESFINSGRLGKQIGVERTQIIEFLRGPWDRELVQSAGPDVLLGEMQGVLDYDDRVLITDSAEGQVGILIHRFEDQDDEASPPERMMSFAQSIQEINISDLLAKVKLHGKVTVYRNPSPISALRKVLVAERYEPPKAV